MKKEILKNNKVNIPDKINIPDKPNTLPCPFCGYNHISFLMDEHDNPAYPWYSQCQMCGAGAERGKTLEDAVNKWNIRVSQPSKHGCWIYNKNGEVRCSNCNTLNCVGTDIKEMTSDINFCYNCGVSMNGEFEFQENTNKEN